MCTDVSALNGNARAADDLRAEVDRLSQHLVRCLADEVLPPLRPPASFRTHSPSLLRTRLRLKAACAVVTLRKHRDPVLPGTQLSTRRIGVGAIDHACVRARRRGCAAKPSLAPAGVHTFAHRWGARSVQAVQPTHGYSAMRFGRACRVRKTSRCTIRHPRIWLSSECMSRPSSKPSWKRTSKWSTAMRAPYFRHNARRSHVTRAGCMRPRLREHTCSAAGCTGAFGWTQRVFGFAKRAAHCAAGTGLSRRPRCCAAERAADRLPQRAERCDDEIRRHRQESACG